MAFAQLTYRSSLRDIETCLRAQSNKLYHMGIRGGVARNTLANANHVRDWRLQAAVKLHTLLDLRGNIPALIHITDGKLHDVNVLDIMAPEPGAFYIMDRAYLDFARLHTLHLNGAHFVLRSKKNTKLRRLSSRTVDRSTGVICDQVVRPDGVATSKNYPDTLRRIRFVYRERGKTLVFLTNDFILDPLTIAQLYRSRWQVELFFKWIKQHLRIITFFGTSENAVKNQIWIAISVYVLVAIIRKRLGLDMSLHTIPQILSLTPFEKMTLKQLLELEPAATVDLPQNNFLTLLD